MKRMALFISSIFIGNLYAMSFEANITINIAARLIKKQTIPAFQQSIQKLLIIPRNEHVILRELQADDPKEVGIVSRLIIDNFNHRPEYKILPEKVLELYCESNSPIHLSEALHVPKTYAFVISRDESLLGAIVARLQNNKDGAFEMVLRRLHVALNTPGYKGIGKTLISACAFMAQDNGIRCMRAAATLPARSFLEHLGWNGSLIETSFKLKDTIKPVILTQFKCEYMIPEKFKGFEWRFIPKQ